MIRSRVNLNARDIIGRISADPTVKGILNRLEAQYRPRGLDRFQMLMRELKTITLADCKDVTEYAERLRRIRNDLLDMDKAVDLPEPH